MNELGDDLEREYAEAEERRERARRVAADMRRKRRRPRQLRILAVAVAALLLAGGVRAALTGQESVPTRGDGGDPGTDTGSYVVALVPDMTAGRAGWCGFLHRPGAERAIRSGTACASAAPAGTPLVVAGGYLLGPRTWLEYAVVTAQVRTVRFSGRRAATRTDPSLPNGWRYAVATARRAGGPLLSVRTFDASGRELRATARGAVRPFPARVRPVTTSRPARRCAIGEAAGHEIRLATVAARTPRVVQRLAARAFAACATTVFDPIYDGDNLVAAMLLDAENPSARAAELPRAPGFSGRRVGRGWIAVQGGTAATRRRLLDRLRPRM